MVCVCVCACVRACVRGVCVIAFVCVMCARACICMCGVCMNWVHCT